MFDRFVVRWKHSRSCSCVQLLEAYGNITQSSEFCLQTPCFAESRFLMPSVLNRSASVMVRTYDATPPRLFSRETKFPLVQCAGQVEVAALRNRGCRHPRRHSFSRVNQLLPFRKLSGQASTS